MFRGGCQQRVSLAMHDIYEAEAQPCSLPELAQGSLPCGTASLWRRLDREAPPWLPHRLHSREPPGQLPPDLSSKLQREAPSQPMSPPLVPPSSLVPEGAATLHCLLPGGPVALWWGCC